MRQEHYLRSVVRLQKQGVAKGVYSICSANKYVLEAAIEFASEHHSKLLVEATSNQVNQYGGYTGLKPDCFARMLACMANAKDYPVENIILGGDHLGPNPWKMESAHSAMEKASELVRDYVLAGFTKIHLDASMRLADDPGDSNTPLNPRVIAKRSAQLCNSAEEAYAQLLARVPEAPPPVYVIGTEVPVPGGVEGSREELSVTSVNDFAETVELTKEAFLEYGLTEAWSRVCAVVVQPGVEFGDHFVDDYDSARAQSLSESLKKFPNLVFEGHSTDYQKPEALRQLVEDGVAVLKVGPALTFALREALFALTYIEDELSVEGERSNLRAVLERVMLKKPEYWETYYEGTLQQVEFARKYSLSDRCRYYWQMPELEEAVCTLVSNLNSAEIPLTVISQFMPMQYERIRQGKLKCDAMSLVKEHVKYVLEQYHQAVEPKSNMG